MNRMLFFILLAMNIFSSESIADVTSDKCSFYFQSDIAVANGNEVSKLISKLPAGNAVKICTGANGAKSYYIASEVLKKKGVCYFNLTRVFKDDSGNENWSFAPQENMQHLVLRDVYMQVSSGICPKQDHADYIQTSGISIGTFSLFNKSWSDAVSSKKLFKNLFEGFFGSEMSNSLVLLESSLFSIGSQDNKPRVLKMDFVLRDVPGYLLTLANATHTWIIDFDIQGANVSIEGISLISE